MKKILAKILVSLVVMLSLAVCCFAAETKFWGFDNENLEAAMQSNFSWNASGVMTATVTSSDPYITYVGSVSMDDYDRIIIRMKYDLNERSDKKAPICQVYYKGTDASGNALALSEANSVKVPLSGLSSNGSFETYVISLNNSNLAGATLDTLRFDIVNCPGSFGIDYIMIAAKNPNPDYIYEFNTAGNMEGWTYANLKAAPTVANGVVSGQNKATNGLLASTFSEMLYGEDYPKVYVRSKISGLTEDHRGLIYTDLYDEKGTSLKTGGWWTSYSGYSNVGITNKAANNDQFVVHTYDFTSKTAYMNNYFKYFVLNMVEDTSATFEVDYIALKNAKSYEWTFDHEGLAEGWTVPANFSLGYGAMNYVGPDTYTNPYFHLNNVSIDASNYDGLEIIMKHELKPNSADTTDVADATDIRLYYYGTAADGSAIGWSEGNTGKVAIGKTSGDSYVRYYIDLKGKSNWYGSTITSLRIDPINENGNFSIDYIRLVPNNNLGLQPIDENLVSASYEFEDEAAGNADGVISVDLGEQSCGNIKKLTISWADENGKALTDYSIIRAFANGDFNGTYKIDKNMLIPNEAKMILIEITDIEKTFSVTVDIPENKLPEDLGKPLYTAAFISDIHIGGWGSETAPNARLVAARKQINEYADFVVINGDLTQWYGARSGEEFAKYNYNGSSYGDNGETDTSYLDQNLGTSQWTVLREYFEGFEVPVYPVQGNHDIRDGDGWNKIYYNPNYWLDTFHSWLDYSNSADAGTQKFTNKVEYSTEHNYYDAWINGNHFIFLEMPKIPSPYYAFGDEQLAWLDTKLYENEETGKPIFIFTHVPTNSVVNASYWDDQIKDDAKFKEILAKHPTAIVVTGHTHYSLDIDTYSSYNGAQEEYSVIHDGGTTTINVPSGTSYNDTTEVSGSHGIIAEVYSDRILLKGRDFVADKWISKGYTLLTFKETPEHSVCPVIGHNDDGKAILKIYQPDDRYTYTWIVDGVETEGISIDIPESFETIIVRAVDANGSYSSVVRNDISDFALDNDDVNTLDNKELRIDTDGESITGAIRFAASVAPSVKRIDDIEYGFIVTRESFLEAGFGGELSFESAINDKVYVCGTNFKAENGIVITDISNGALDNGEELFTCALTGINAADADRVNEVMAVRPYMIYRVEDVEYIIYGNMTTASLAEVAKLVDTTELPDDYKAFVDGVVRLAN